MDNLIYVQTKFVPPSEHTAYPLIKANLLILCGNISLFVLEFI